MEERLEVFERHGTEEKRIGVKADEVLEAIAEGRDIHIEYANIDGYLDIRKIDDKLKRDEKCRLLVKGNIGIMHSEIRGDAVFMAATFSGDANFSSTTFSGNVDFISTTFSGYAYFTGATFSRNADFRDATFSGDAL